MKKLMLCFSILILSLTVGAQKSDFKTAVKEITVKAQTQTADEFSATAKNFVTEFYPNGFDEKDFVKKASALSDGFKPDCASCVGGYIACTQTCRGITCVFCTNQFQVCWTACGGGNPPLAKTK